MTWLSDLPLLLKGGAIGLAISVPVGPIGVLCIQRTLAGGRIVGLASGLGAATADAIYAAIAVLGLTFISEILIGQQALLRLIGGGILILLGIRILLSRPPDESATEERSGLGGAYASTFILTLTNPLTILFVAAIFIGIGATATSGSLLSGTILVLGVFLGSTLWWFLLSGGVSLLRDRVTPKAMRWVNWISGTIIALFGASAIIVSLGHHRFSC
jgi:threonine/homoserine/homoserine lactone efflux protein